MKKHLKDVYKDICSYENIHQAYIKARKCKRFRVEVLDFTNNLEENLVDIQNELLNHTYRVGEYREFYIHEPKKRLIMALPFKDRVVQWAIYQVLNPVFEKGYITDSFACIPGRGTHSAVQRLSYWLHQVDRKPEKYYYLKLDISKYFYRVDHAVLLEILSTKIKDPELMWLFRIIVDCENTQFGLPLGTDPDQVDERLPNKGMPIGNLTSQMFANIYLNELDQFAKRQMHIHYYIRYMDDVIILSHDKAQLHLYKEMIEEFLETKLKLNLNRKTAIRPISLGIEFVGYRLWPTHIKVKKSSALKMKRRLNQVKNLYNQGKIDFEKVNATVQSYFGVLKHCNSQSLKNKIFGDFILHRRSEDDSSE
ncbi:MAG: reverse transcriptase domain-containing protein [Thermincola sp.]|jgi:retron-type reverse transcriptase|nr:reverse transcriptase domain-containing protein [Thermincola sp.]MDT3703193.1 reverse transcriptase domain-containing protein [Thermincola sp.]